MLRQFKFIKNKLVPFLVNGGTVMTLPATGGALKPAAKAAGHEWVFFTSISPEGDIVRKVPPTTIYRNNDLTLWQADYARHLKQVNDFMKGFNGISSFGNNLSLGLGSMPGLSMLLFSNVRDSVADLLQGQPDDVWGILYLAIQTVLPIITRRYKNNIISAIVQRFAKTFLTKKLKGKLATAQ